MKLDTIIEQAHGAHTARFVFNHGKGQKVHRYEYPDYTFAQVVESFIDGEVQGGSYRIRQETSSLFVATRSTTDGIYVHMISRRPVSEATIRRWEQQAAEIAVGAKAYFGDRWRGG